MLQDLILREMGNFMVKEEAMLQYFTIIYRYFIGVLSQ